MKKKLFFRLFISLFSVSAVSLSLLLLISLETVRTQYTDAVEEGLEKSAEIMVYSIEDAYNSGNFALLNSTASKAAERTGYRVTVIRADGIVIFDSDQSPELMVNHSDRKEVMEALSGERGRARRFSTTKDAGMTYVALPIKNGNEITGVLRLSVYLKNVNNSVYRFYYRFFLIAFLIFAGMTVIAFFLSKNVYGPVEKLVKASRKVSEGDFDAKVNLYKNDEFRELAENFNYMTSSLKKYFSQIEENRDELQGIIKTMEEGLLLIDREGKVVIANRGAEEMLGKESLAGKSYREIIRLPEFNELLIRSAGEEGVRSTEMSLAGKDLLVNASILPMKGYHVVTMFDITGIRRVDRVRKEFILNASHELRTPLTAIKGFLETMEDSINEENRRFLEIIERHTDRLINIVEDLIAISSAESSEVLQTEMTDISEVARQALVIVKPKAEQKGLYMKIESDNPPLSMMDPFRMEQVLINLFDNAVKYTDSGGVSISVKHDDKWLKVDVEDTGIGIPEEHRSRIFERFYVADKSRTKKNGGTGLGLSIVKHIVLMHGGDVSFRSYGKGTVFSVRIPVKS